LVTYYVDTAPYPASGCTDSATPGNCITDAQIQTEITKVMGINGWTGGINKMFLLYTSSGEGSCFDSSNTSCAYVQYCAYHSFYGGTTTPIIYGNQPYGGVIGCVAGGQTTPNSDIAADGAASTASHEISEAITDPLLNAWFDASGNENGDSVTSSLAPIPGTRAKRTKCGTGIFSNYRRSIPTTNWPVSSPGPNLRSPRRGQLGPSRPRAVAART